MKAELKGFFFKKKVIVLSQVEIFKKLFFFFLIGVAVFSLLYLEITVSGEHVLKY